MASSPRSRLTGIAEIAHDFNNLLQIIDGSAHLLAEEIDETDGKRQFVEAILQASGQSAALIRRLLVRSEAASEPTGSCKLDATTRTIIETVAPILPRSVTVSRQLRAPDAKVASSPEGIHRVVTNLLLNSSEAMPMGGEVVVRTSLTLVNPEHASQSPGLEPGRYGVLVVSDEGTGMPPALVERIFEPFTTTKEDSPARGLGLASVFGLVKEAGGYISVDSTEREGTTFQVYLPVVG